MMNTITLKRIVKARRAMARAQNPTFKKFWKGVVKDLSTKAGD
jgi:hypothetical protein